MLYRRYDERPKTLLSESTQRFLQAAADREYSILCGRNNSGKSYLLKTLAEQFGESASYLGPARYQNFATLNSYTPNRNRRRRTERFQNFQSQWSNKKLNIDNSPLNLQQAIAELSDNQRDKFIEIMESLLNSRMEIRHTVEGNSMSQQYISVDGHNISFTSSGYRLVAALVTSMLDDEYDTVLLDEPELGISPETQSEFAELLFDREQRRRYFPHIRSLVIATHSTVFLDRSEIRNNFFVDKRGDVIDLSEIETVGDISRLHFFLLGNRFESLYLPSIIIIVEGSTDHEYIKRVVEIKYSDRNVSIFCANSDSRTKEILFTIKSLLGTIQGSPYQDRIFVVLDSVHSHGLRDSLIKQGMAEENVIVWTANGIEHYYPAQCLRTVFSGTGDLGIEGDWVELNGIKFTKKQLSDKILPLITVHTVYPDEFCNEFLVRIDPYLR